MKSKHKQSNKFVWITLIAAAVVLGYGFGPGHWFVKSATAELHGATVKRGPLRISVVQRGNLAAKSSLSVKSEIEGQTTVIYLIPEGTQVKPGDLLVELDASDLVEKRVGQEISVQNAEAAYTKAKAQYEIQESQNKSDIELAERKLTFAMLDQDKYLKGDYDQLLQQAQDKILLAEQKKTQAQNTFNWSTSLADKGFLTKSELDRDNLDFQSADVQLKQAQVAKTILDKYDDPRKKTELEANLKEAERGLERAKLRAQAMIVDYEAALKSSEARLKLELEKLAKYVDQIAKARISSTTTGMVVYTRGEGGRMSGGDPVQEGSQVRERQEILTIPKTGGMIAEASIHESVLKQVAIGLPCTLSVDALPGLSFRGKVQYVALLPDKGSWWANPNQRLYKTEIAVEEVHPDMHPGMSCSIEILTEDIPDALYVPLQSVLADGGQTIAFVAKDQTIEHRPVKVGRSTDKWVEILEGLNEGEEVLLGPPAGFTPQSSEKEKVVPASITAQEAGQAEQAPAGAAPPAGAADKPARGDRSHAGAGDHRGGERGKRPTMMPGVADPGAQGAAPADKGKSNSTSDAQPGSAASAGSDTSGQAPVPPARGRE